MKNSKWLLLLFYWLPLCVPAQGLIMDDTGKSDTLPYLPLFNGRKSATVLPASRSLQTYSPAPADQGGSLACTAFSCGYGSYSMLQAMRKGESISKNLHSTAFIFNQIPNSDKQGAKLEDVLDKLKVMGDCRLITFPHDHIATRTTPPNSAINEAKDLLFPIQYNPIVTDIQHIKQVLSWNLPVIIGAKVESDFRNRYMGKALWSPQAPSVPHAMLIVGYNDGDDTFEILNSYGRNWGTGGFIKIKQNDLVNADVLKKAFVLMPASTKGAKMDVDYLRPISPDTTQKDIVGQFSLKNLIKKVPNTEGRDSFVFETTAVRFNADRKLYETHRQNWRTGEVFQFMAAQMPMGHHLYAFSLDPSNKVTIHWPPDARWTETDKKTIDYYAYQNGQKPVSSAIPSSNIQLTLPSPDEGLQLNKVGEDKLIVLLSSSPLSNFKEQLDRFASVSGDAWARLHSAFGDALIPTERLVYFDDAMTVKRFVFERQGWVTPLILAISVH